VHETRPYYQEGRGVRLDWAAAAALYRAAAAQLHAGAESALGYCYETGQGVQQAE
jgi:TPR repeat protein